MQQRGKTNTSNAVLPNTNAAVCSNRHLFQLDVWHSFWVSLCYQLLVWSFQCIGLHTFHKSPLGWRLLAARGEAPSSRRHKPRPHSSHPRHATTSHLLEHSFASHHHDKKCKQLQPSPSALFNSQVSCLSKNLELPKSVSRGWRKTNCLRHSPVTGQFAGLQRKVSESHASLVLL